MKKIEWLRDNPLRTQTAFLAICALFIVADQSGWLAAFSRAQLRAMGKALGTGAIAFALLATLYYLVREFYLKHARKGGVNSFVSDKAYRVVLSFFRTYHPIFGMIAFYSAFLHLYFLWLRNPLRYNWRIESGLATFAALMLLFYFGQKINFSPMERSWRKRHKFTAVFFFAIYLGHVFLRV